MKTKKTWLPISEHRELRGGPTTSVSVFLKSGIPFLPTEHRYRIVSQESCAFPEAIQQETKTENGEWATSMGHSCATIDQAMIAMIRGLEMLEAQRDEARAELAEARAGSHGWRVDEKKYIRQGGTRCPFCGSDDIEGGSMEVDAGSTWQDVACNNCDSQWQDVYLLREINDLQDGGREPTDPALPGYPMAGGK